MDKARTREIQNQIQEAVRYAEKAHTEGKPFYLSMPCFERLDEAAREIWAECINSANVDLAGEISGIAGGAARWHFGQALKVCKGDPDKMQT